MFYKDDNHNLYQVKKLNADDDFANLLSDGWVFISYPVTNVSLSKLLQQAKQHLSQRQFNKLASEIYGENDAGIKLDIITEFLLHAKNCHFYIYNALDGSMYHFDKLNFTDLETNTMLNNNGKKISLSDYLNAIIENFSKYNIYKIRASNSHVFLTIYGNLNTAADLDRIMLKILDAVPVKRIATN